MFDINKLYEARNNYDFTCDILDPKTWILEKDYDIMLRSRSTNNDPDCHINHFGYNFYFRTKAWMDRRKYQTIGRCISAIKNTAKHIGLRAINFKIKHPDEDTVYL